MPVLDEGEYLAHYGILRKSGRYPWGSGKNPLQRSRTFLETIKQHEKDGLSAVQIAKLYSDPPDNPFTTTDLKAAKSHAVTLQKADQIRTAQKLREKGMGASEIGKKMGLNESTVRSLLAPGRQDRLDVLQATADMLKKEVHEKGFIDVGSQVQRDLPIFGDSRPGVGISKDKFDTALAMLKEEGYPVHTVRIRQVGTGEFTRRKALGLPGSTQKEIWKDPDKIKLITSKSDDGGRTYQDKGLQPVLSINPKRVGVRYKEDGGADADGVIYVRPNVDDISLGKSQYAQVRIMVGDGHYLKGMAIYKKDLPPGVDLQFNTNKSNTGNKLDALKEVKRDKEGNIDPKNPFGAMIKPDGQILGPDGKVSSAMNLINEEGDWAKWSRNLSRQVLSKQEPDLAESQLALTFERKRKDLDDILALTNPTIKKKLLESFAEDTDSSAVHLKAANMPMQATKVLLPVKSVKEREVFAPTYEDGTRVALVRFPHAGRFEIPELVVNNRNREARELFGIGKGRTAPDAIGINPRVAEKLSGADFDGDSVVVIPNGRGLIKSQRSLDGLKDFDPQQYKVPLGPPTKEYPKGKPIITDEQKQPQMGKVTNLIADMTVRGASPDELAAAVRHSMVVIDSAKHNLDYKASERDNGILALKKKYQGVTPKGGLRGASTLITRTTAREDVVLRKAPTKADLEGRPDAQFIKRGIDIRTGEKVTVPTGETRKDGSLKTFRSTKGAETKDAYSLVSDQGPRGTRIEQVYADHSNRLKALANEARKEMVATPNLKMSESAKKVYKAEVDELNTALDNALKNAPRERQAQALANVMMAQRKQANPDMDKEEKRKLRSQVLDEARIRTGAKKDRIDITPRQWEAIQAGAISNSRLQAILSNTDTDKIRKLATPRDNPVMSSAMQRRAKAMLNSGATPAEIADALGVAQSTLQSSLAGGE